MKFDPLSYRWFFIPVLAFLIAISVATFYSTPVRAGNEFQPISPEELKMTSEPQAPGAAAIVLFRQVDRDDKGGTSHNAREDDYYRIKILTEEGRKQANIEIPFRKRSGADVVGIKARTIKPDGTISNFDGKIIEQSVVKAKGVKVMAKTFTLPDVQVGSIIEYYYTYLFPEYAVYDSHWILSYDLFTKSAKFSLKPYSSAYSNLSVRWNWQNLPPGTAQPKDDADGIVRLEANNIPAFQTEDFMPPEGEMKSRVNFIYSEETPEKDLGKFWQKIGKKLNSNLESFVGKRKAMEQAVSQIVSPNDSPEVKLQKIYARVQQIRNTSFEVEKTEQETKRAKEKEANNVEDLWKRGYGNGRDITWLFLALVRAAGIEAYGVWVSDRRNYFFSPNLMDDTKLDANVVLVKLNGKDLYLDPGAAFTPYGLLEWTETGVRGLRLDKDGGTWIITTLPTSADSRIERKADLKLSDTGDLEGKLTVTFIGLEAQSRRVEERNVDETERKKYLEDEVKEYIPAAIEVELSNKPDWTSSATPLVTEYNLKVPGWASSAGRRALIPVGLFSATEKHLFDHSNRVHPIYFTFPFAKLDDITIDLPLGWQVTSVPPAQNQDQKVVAYACKAENVKGALHLTRKLSVDILLLETQYYGALRAFFQGVRTGDEQQIILQPM